MSHVRDMSLAESGRMKIRWVQDFMPALVAIRARFEREKPCLLYTSDAADE